MKRTRIVTIAITICMLVTMLGIFTINISAAPTEPTTTTIDGETYYQISTANELLWFANEVNVNKKNDINGILTNNIDLSSVCSETLGTWTPIGAYKGVFDGAGKEVTGLYCVGQEYGGLFKWLYSDDALIKNLTVRGYVNATKYAGGIVGMHNFGKVENCINYATVEATDSGTYAAGIASYANSDIVNCKNYGAIGNTSSGKNLDVGGIVGYQSSDATVSGCSNYGPITVSTSGTLGGISGVSYGTIINCYNEGTVTYTGTHYNQDVGGIAGCSIYDESSISNCFNNGVVASTQRGKEYTDMGAIAGDVDNFATDCGFNASKFDTAFGLSNGATVTNVVASSDESTSNGEMAYALGDGWGQQIGVDPIPVLGGAKVYRHLLSDTLCSGAATAEYVYTNSATYTGSGSVIHDNNLGAEAFTNGICNNCGWECTHVAPATFTYGNITDTTHDATYTCCNKLLAGVAHGDFSATVRDEFIVAICACQKECGTATVDTLTTFTYDGNEKEVTVVYENWLPSEKPVVTYSGDRKSAGTHAAILDYIGAGKRYDFTIDKATPTAEHFEVTYPITSYSPVAKELSIKLKNDYTGMGAQTVRIYKDGLEVSEVKELGNYVITLDIAEGDNFTAIDGLEIMSFEIVPSLIIDLVVKISATEATYNGSAQIPTISLVLDDTVLDRDYTVTWDKEGFVDAGTYTATVQGIGNYTGTVEMTYVINPKPASELTVTLDPQEAYFTYLVQKPTITVKDGDKLLVEGADYDVVWYNNPEFIYATRYDYSINGKGNYGNSFNGAYYIRRVEPVLTLTSPSPSIMPNMKIKMTLDVKNPYNESCELLPLTFKLYYKVGDGSPVENDGLEFTLPNGFTIGEILTVWVESEERSTSYEAGKSNEIKLLVGQVDYTEMISSLEDDVAELNKLIETGGDIDKINEAILAVQGRIDVLELAKDAYKDADTALEAKMNTAITDATTALSQTVTVLKSELNDKIDDLQTQITTNSGNVTDIQTRITEIGALITTLQGVDTALQNKDSELAQDITEAITKAEDDLEKAVTDLTDTLNGKVDALQQQIDSNDGDITVIQNQISDIGNLITTLQSADTALQNKDSELAQDITEAITKAEDDLEKAVTDLTNTLNGKVDALQQQIDSNDTDIATIQTQITDIGNLITTLQGVDTALQNKDSELAQDIAEAITKAEDELQIATDALQTNIDNLTTELTEVEQELLDAIKAGDSALSSRISSLNSSLNRAITALNSADEELKSELSRKIHEAEVTLDAAIEVVQMNLDKAKSELIKSIADGDADLDAKITALGAALEAAEAASKAADASIKSYLTERMNDADTALDLAVKQVQKNLDAARAELDEKDKQLNTMTIVALCLGGVGVGGNIAFLTYTIIDKRRLAAKKD